MSEYMDTNYDEEMHALYDSLQHTQQSAVATAEKALIGIVHPVGEESLAVITRLSPTETEPKYVGNVVRRTCMAAGKAACADGCALRTEDAQSHEVDARRRLAAQQGEPCVDANLSKAFEKLHVYTDNEGKKDVLMVAVTGDEVGFGEDLGMLAYTGELTENPEGWREIKGYNAFFARPNEVAAIGSRLADCAHLEFEFKDRDGQTVIGFEHGTRPNMKGSSAYAFKDKDGEPVSYTHYVLAQAIHNYGADPTTMNIRVSSSIRPENFVKHFDSAEKMEGHIPGWLDDGFATNASNPDWRPGDPVTPEDEWHADARGLIMRDITEAMQALGIPSERLVADDMLDPADSAGEFSSFQNKATYGDTRDLYLIAHRSAFQ